MNKSYIRQLMLSILFFIITAFNSIYGFFNNITLILFLLVFIILSYYVIGYERNRNRYQKDVMISIISFSLIYYMITYFSGLFFGFNKSGYVLEFVPIIKNIIPVIITIVLGEIIRYMFITKGSIYKSIVVFTIINLILLDITLLINSYSYGMFLFFFGIFIPSISKNIFLTYATYKAGFKVTILYRIIFEIPHYILPIFPAFGNYLDSVLNFLVPFVFLFIIYKSFLNISNKKIVSKDDSKVSQKVFFSLSFVFLCSIVLLTSGIFKYYIVTIGSGSMEPSIKVGDIVLVEKLNDQEIDQLEIGDVLVFNHDKLVIIHRIVNILEVNGSKYFYTKGDHNLTQDGYPVKEKDVIGTTNMRVPYLGYPTVIVSRIINR